MSRIVRSIRLASVSMNVLKSQTTTKSAAATPAAAM